MADRSRDKAASLRWIYKVTSALRAMMRIPLMVGAIIFCEMGAKAAQSGDPKNAPSPQPETSQDGWKCVKDKEGIKVLNSSGVEVKKFSLKSEVELLSKDHKNVEARYDIDAKFDKARVPWRVRIRAPHRLDLVAETPRSLARADSRGRSSRWREEILGLRVR